MSELRSRSLREDVEALRDTMAARFKAEHSPGYKKYDLARMELDEILRNHPPEPGQPAAYKKCAECKGKGWDWLAGAPAHETNKYPCEKCNGTGKVLEQPADFIEVDGIHVDTQWVRDIRGKLAETDFKLQRAEAGQPAAVPVDNTCTKHNGFGHSDDCIYCNAESAAGQSEPVAWMHDQNGRVDVIHDSVRQLWLKVGQKYSAQFCREIVPCMVEHYTIPLYTHTIPAAPAVPETNSFLKERAQLEQEWCNLRALKSQYERALGQKTIVPEGWKLVPIEPTKEMWKKAVTMDVWPLTPQSFKALYEAMLEASPEQQGVAK